MADITALENRIRSLIKTNGNQEITGAVAQQVLLDIANSLNAYLEAEANSRQSGDSTLQQGINTERTDRQNADAALGQRITNEIQAEKERAEAAFDNLDMIDAAGSALQPTQITLTLRKNDGSEEDPDWRTLTEIIIPSATYNRAGLMSVNLYNKLDEVCKYSQFAEIIEPSSHRPTLPSNGVYSIFCIAFKAGTYTNFKNSDNEPLVVDNDGLHIFIYTIEDDWRYETLFTVDNQPTNNSKNLINSGAVFEAIQAAIQAEKERAEAAFDDLDMIDAAGSVLQQTQITLTLRKNDGSEEDPDWRTLTEIIIPSATYNRAGLMSAEDKQKINNLEQTIVEKIQESGLVKNEQDDTLYVSDSSGNVVAKINASGIKAIEFIIKNGKTLTQLLAEKVNVVSGKGLSTNDYTDEDKALLESLINLINGQNGDTLYISDVLGNVIAKFNNKGLTTTDILTLLSNGLFISDKLGNLGLKYDEDGLDANKLSQHLLTYIQNNISIPSGGSAIESVESMGADINMFICYGQSLSTAAGNNNVPTNYPLNIMQFDSIEAKIAGGIRTMYEDYDSPQATLDTYYGGALIHAKNTGWEGSLKKMCWAINEMLSVDNGIDAEAQNLLMLGLAPGISGSNIENLTKYPVNASYIYAYERLIESVKQAQKKAASINKTFAVPALFWVQGEGNFRTIRKFDEQTHTWGNSQTTTPELYKAAMAVLFNQLNTDIKAITGQTKDVQFILYQPATHATCAGRGISTYVDETTTPANASVIKAMLDMSLDENYPNVHWGGAMYQYAYYATDLHPTASATVAGYGSIPYEHMGAIAGIQAKRVCFGGEPIRPILPKSHTITHVGNKYLIDLEFDVQFGPLVLDTSAEVFHNPYSNGVSNYGFEIKNGSNTDIITNVSVSRMNHITIACSENPEGLTLTYARNGIGFTESQGAGKNLSSSNILFKTGGGCLRDSQGDFVKVRIGESKIGINNFAPIFDYSL